jgi:hypothetical protein
MSWPIVSRVNYDLGQRRKDIDILYKVSNHGLIFNVTSQVQHNTNKQVSQLLQLGRRQFG